MDHPVLSEAIAQIAHTINAPRDRDSQLDTIVRAAGNSIPGMTHAGISIAHRDGWVETLAATDDLVEHLDDLQYSLNEGPCLHAIDADPVVVVQHARHEQRWPRFIPAAVKLGLRSQMGLRLYLDDKTRGGLNLYSSSSDTIDPEAEYLAELFASHAALALGRVRVEQNLSAALASRTVIGIALGIVMERFGMDRDGAFKYLTRLSSSSETKLRVVAQQLLDEVSGRPDRR